MPDITQRHVEPFDLELIYLQGSRDMYNNLLFPLDFVLPNNTDWDFCIQESDSPSQRTLFEQGWEVLPMIVTGKQ